MVDPRSYPVDAERYRSADHGWLAELERVVVAGPPYHRMGTRAIEDAAWLVDDIHRPAELDLRARLLDEVPGAVNAVLPGAEAAVDEATGLVADWLRHHRPGHLTAELEDPSGPGGDLAPVGRAVQEDLCIMEHGDRGWCLTAAVLCFPTYWRLGDKLGRPQGAVHGPVPHYARELEARVDHFFDRLAPGRIVARRNWGFSPDPLLFVPERAALGPPGKWEPETLWLRSERQTLRRLPASGAVVFTIRVQQAPATALVGRPTLTALLAGALASWPPELEADRGGPRGWVPAVRTWLDGLNGSP